MASFIDVESLFEKFRVQRAEIGSVALNALEDMKNGKNVRIGKRLLHGAILVKKVAFSHNRGRMNKYLPRNRQL